MIKLFLDMANFGANEGNEMGAGDFAAHDVLINVTQQIAMFTPFLPSHAPKREKSIYKYLERLSSYDTSLSALSSSRQKAEHQQCGKP